MAKERLDHVIAKGRPALSKSYIQSLIMQAKVRVDGVVITKAGTLVDPSADIQLSEEQPRYVSRAGFKLEHALKFFNIDVTGLVALDAGISTGGFTDCLLQHGVKKVYGIDVGYGQVHEKIRQNVAVIVMERTNLRHLAKLPEQVDMVTLDLSFISVLKVIDQVAQCMKPGAHLIVLIKPQFEAERSAIAKGGIVKDETVHQHVIKKITEGITAAGFSCTGVTESPITGTQGNKEFLAYFKKHEN